MSDYTAAAGRFADSVHASVDRKLAAASADWGIGTVTAINPGSIAGTVAVDTGSGTSIPMRRAAGYSPTVSDKVIWLLSRAGDWTVVDKLA